MIKKNLKLKLIFLYIINTVNSNEFNFKDSLYLTEKVEKIPELLDLPTNNNCISLPKEKSIILPILSEGEQKRKEEEIKDANNIMQLIKNFKKITDELESLQNLERKQYPSSLFLPFLLEEERPEKNNFNDNRIKELKTIKEEMIGNIKQQMIEFGNKRKEREKQEK